MNVELLFGQNRCDLCHERLRPRDEVAEMYDPNDEDPSRKSMIVHADCGLSRGMEVA